jgi:hypothetical protein
VSLLLWCSKSLQCCWGDSLKSDGSQGAVGAALANWSKAVGGSGWGNGCFPLVQN